MKLIRNPRINAAIILLVTAFYSLVFIVTSGHLEFERILARSRTSASTFWNAWSDFLRQGHLQIIGYLYLALAAAIVLLALVRKRNYDEYQASLLGRGFLLAGLAMGCLFPAALLLVLSDPNYCVETLLFLVVAHWSTVLIAELIYALHFARA